ncbi:hypothetical protein EDC44_11542 [Cricetibacter osteomyelitidis]|uniref:Uncharacterized protein n=1 Tax=Cricetibacter osteomyelitidis TaxID=1521931 RepID=A0A4R2SW82_9PAST|nr:hypothetical protein EDC44_11542 [Cricetibacter osteomyelitidis]
MNSFETSISKFISNEMILEKKFHFCDRDQTFYEKNKFFDFQINGMRVEKRFNFLIFITYFIFNGFQMKKNQNNEKVFN